MKRLLTTQISRFLGVGAATTLVTVAVIFATKLLSDWHDAVINAFGYLVGFGFNFRLNSTWTFAHSGSRMPALVRFGLAAALAYCLNLLTVLLLIKHTAISSYLAHVLGVPVYTATSFILSRRFVFRSTLSPP
jgi:putative flippase GtrA